jgi:hypothetical protein
LNAQHGTWAEQQEEGSITKHQTRTASQAFQLYIASITYPGGAHLCFLSIILLNWCFLDMNFRGKGSTSEINRRASVLDHCCLATRAARIPVSDTCVLVLVLSQQGLAEPPGCRSKLQALSCWYHYYVTTDKGARV